MEDTDISALDYVSIARTLHWPEIQMLWGKIRDRNTPGWPRGKALEHLIIRGFELSGASVHYPYNVPPDGHPFEQIDGLVYLNGIPVLVECKDKETQGSDVVARLKCQLDRRPPATLASVFISGSLTAGARTCFDRNLPHRITVWETRDIERAINERDFLAPLAEKFHYLCQYGLQEPFDRFDKSENVHV
jgi:hypothetical protein